MAWVVHFEPTYRIQLLIEYKSNVYIYDMHLAFEIAFDSVSDFIRRLRSPVRQMSTAAAAAESPSDPNQTNSSLLLLLAYFQGRERERENEWTRAKSANYVMTTFKIYYIDKHWVASKFASLFFCALGLVYSCFILCLYAIVVHVDGVRPMIIALL